MLMLSSRMGGDFTDISFAEDHKNINQLIQQINKCQPCSQEYVDLMKCVVPMFLEHSDKEEQNHLTKLQLSLKDSDVR